MKLDTRAIVITITVIILGIAAWLLVQPALNDNPSAATTSRGLGDSTSTSTTTSGPTTTSVPTTTRAPTTATAAPTTTASTTSREATTTTATALTTTEAPPSTRLDFEPDVSLCEANNLAPTKCRWVDRIHPPINTDPREEPEEYLRQLTAFIDWSIANPSRGRDLGFIAFGGDLLQEITDQRTRQLEERSIVLDRQSVEDARLIDSADERAEMEARILAGQSHRIIDGEIVDTFESADMGVWRFVAELRDGAWRVVEMGAVE